MSGRLTTAPSIPLNEVEWRIDGNPYNNKARYVPYIDARDCARLLDQWLGPDNWQDKYEEGTLGGQAMLWCYLSVRSGDEWVTKVDVGTAGNTEPQKSLVSDAFKRCAIVKWGVGRNVYDLPKDIWASCDVKTGRDNKERAYKSKTADAEILEELTKRGIQDAAVKPVVEEHEERVEIEPTPGFDAPREVEKGSEEPPTTREPREPNAEGTTGEPVQEAEPTNTPSASPSPAEQGSLNGPPLDTTTEELVRQLEVAVTAEVNGPDGKRVTRGRVTRALLFATQHNGGVVPSGSADFGDWSEASLRTVVKELELGALV